MNMYPSRNCKRKKVFFFSHSSGFSRVIFPKSCADFKNSNPKASSGRYVIDPDGEKALSPFTVYCDMDNENGFGVTVIIYESENRTSVNGYEGPGSYSRDIHYTGASLSQQTSLTNVSSYCEQFIKYECRHSLMLKELNACWVSRDSSNMTYWGGAKPGSNESACGTNQTCADPQYGCNCDKNDYLWREDSGLLTDKTYLPVKQLRFGDTGSQGKKGYRTFCKFKCR